MYYRLILFIKANPSVFLIGYQEETEIVIGSNLKCTWHDNDHKAKGQKVLDRRFDR